MYQVQHIGLGAIPRLVSLKEYVPPTSRELQDWKEEYEVCVAYVRWVHVVVEVGVGGTSHNGPSEKRTPTLQRTLAVLRIIACNTL